MESPLLKSVLKLLGEEDDEKSVDSMKNMLDSNNDSSTADTKESDFTTKPVYDLDEDMYRTNSVPLSAIKSVCYFTFLTKPN